MRFDFKKRPAEFGVFKNRREKDTGDEEPGKLKAIDLPVRLQLKPKELDMLVPTQGVPLSQFLFGDDMRKPALQTTLLSPMKVYRAPEHLKISIYDDRVDKRKVMTFPDCRVENPHLEFDETKVYLCFKVEIHPGNQLQRISDNVEGQVCDFECKATQPELFDSADDDEGAQGGEGQQPLMGDPEEGNNHDDDD